MNKLENGIIKYQIDLERYKNGRADEVVEMLDKAAAQVSKFVRRTSHIHTKERYKEVAKKLRGVSKALRQEVEDGTDIDGLIDAELERQERLLKSAVNVTLDMPSREQIKAAALFRPITEGMTWKSYLDGIESGLFNVWDSAVRTGYLTGETTASIVRRVMGGVTRGERLTNPGQIRSLRNSVYANTRTALQSFAAEARNAVFERNEEYFGEGGYKYKYLATLDSRSCLVCAASDGSLYRTLSEAPQVPRHRGCRCVVVPYFNVEGGERASAGGYVSDKVDFEEWLRAQDERTQLDVLGRARYEMFKRGERISQFVDNGRVLTLEELRG